MPVRGRCGSPTLSSIVGGDLDDRWATGPVLLAEVLSGPAERPTWRTNPRSFYDSQASKPILCLRSARRRYGNGCVRLAPFASQPREITGLDEVIPMAALETELPLIEAYAGLTFGHEQR